MPISRFIIVFILLVLFSFSAKAAHIVGGQIVYTCIDNDITDDKVRFEIVATMYRDSYTTGATLDDNAEFGVYQKNAFGDWTAIEVLNVPLSTRDTIPFDNSDPCVEIPPRVGVEKGEYKFNLVLDVSDTDYMIAYQRCCRNGTINNLVNPGDTGAAFHVVISPEAQESCDNSPKFENFPPIFICENQQLFVDQSASDIDGDQLRYRFCAPLTAGGTDGSMNGTVGVPSDACTGVTPSPVNCPPPFEEVVFIAPYTSSQPMAGDPIISIDPNTGLITGTPKMLGQYVVGICVEEFRGGVKIGEIIRDFQFNVVECDPTVITNMDADSLLGPKSYLYRLCGDLSLDIENLSIKVDKIVSYEWIMDVGNTSDTLVTRDASFTFDGLGTYFGTLILNKGFECADTAEIRVDVLPETIADYSFSYDTCVAGPITFVDLSTTLSTGIVSYLWDFGEGTSSAQNVDFVYSTPGDKEVLLTIRDVNGCVSQKLANIAYFPAPETLVTKPNTFVGCEPAIVTFENLSAPIDSSYTFNWTFGDGSTSNELSPTHTYESQGVYSVSLQVISPIGCEVSRDFDNIISIKSSPVADFTYSPDEFNSLQSELFLNDQSFDAERLQWIIPNVGVSTELNPTFSLPDTGRYEIILVAYHASGCPDTLIKTIDVTPLSTLFFPNAFTPNNDGSNDDFRGVGVLEGVRDYNLSIWNRWGENVFSTDDIYDGWGGSMQNSGKDSPEGTYIYTYSFTSARGEKKSGQGKILLLR